MLFRQPIMQRLSFISEASFPWLLRGAALVGVAFAIAALGPFGTSISQSFLTRFAYWLVLLSAVGACVWCVRWVSVRRWGQSDFWLRFLSEAIGFNLIFPPLAWLMSSLFLQELLSFDDYLFIAGNVMALTCASALFNWIFTSVPAKQTVFRPRLFDRLPATVTAQIVRLTINDHYVVVILDDDTEHRILMRLTDAIREMDGVPGFNTHRSHWVSRDHITRRLREGQRDYLLLSDGARVPISKTYQPAVAAAGFA